MFIRPSLSYPNSIPNDGNDILNHMDNVIDYLNNIPATNSIILGYINNILGHSGDILDPLSKALCQHSDILGCLSDTSGHVGGIVGSVRLTLGYPLLQIKIRAELMVLFSLWGK